MKSITGIREEDGQWSVLDLIEVVGRQKDPYNVWKRLSERHYTLRRSVKNFKFSGQGQRITLVCDRKGALEIIAKLPGEKWKYYLEGLKTAFKALKMDKEVDMWFQMAANAEWGDPKVYAEVFFNGYRFLYESEFKSEILFKGNGLGIIVEIPPVQDLDWDYTLCKKALEERFDRALENLRKKFRAFNAKAKPISRM